MLIKFILFPFTLIYHGVTALRNHLFDIGYSRSIPFDIPVISVGNLSVGGTGKTPHVEYLIRLLKNKYKVATLSRGYGRKTKGIILADRETTAGAIGDEPFQFYNKFGNQISVTVGEERALAIPTILFEKPETELIILDDAYQHRNVKPRLNILLTDFRKPFYDDLILPSGRLRESRKGANRADILIVTKCPENLTKFDQSNIIKKIKNYSKPDALIFFTGIRYLNPHPLFTQFLYKFSSNIILLTGIAKADLLASDLAKKHRILKHIKYSDHHNYTKEDLQKLQDIVKQEPEKDKCILTTEKDMVKLMDKNLNPLNEVLPIFYIPIEIYFLKDQELFDEIIFKTIKLPG